MQATPLCLMSPVEAIFLLIALGKLRLMKNFHPPESCRKSTLVLNLGLPHISATFSRIPRSSRATKSESTSSPALSGPGVRGNQEPQGGWGLWGEQAGVQGALVPSSVLHLRPQWAPGPRSASSSGLHVLMWHLSTQASQSVLDCQRINRTPKASPAGCWRGVPNESQKGELAGIARHKRTARLRVGSRLQSAF